MLTYDVIKKFLIQDLTEAQIVKNLKNISYTFTQDRENISKIYNSRDAVSSYACFYLPTNAQKMNFVLDRLGKNKIDEIKNSLIVEIGTGPGTYLLSLMEFFKDSPTSYLGIDHNPLMLEQGRKIQENLFPGVECSWTKSFRSEEVEKTKNITVIFGNSLNEMGAKVALKIIKELAPQNIICIEPGTKQSFSHISKFRDDLIKENFKIIYPCSSISACPIIADNLDDWCHQVIRTKLDPSTMRLSQLASLDRTSMPAIIHFYSLLKEEGKSKTATVTRLIKQVKHAYFWQVCIEDEGQLKLVTIEVPKKLFSKVQIKELNNISTGLRVSFIVDKELGDGVVRVSKLELV